MGLENIYNFNKVDFDKIEKFKDLLLRFFNPKYEFYKKSKDIIASLNVDEDAKIVCIHVPPRLRRFSQQ